jgi:hypothetical protein
VLRLFPLVLLAACSHRAVWLGDGGEPVRDSAARDGLRVDAQADVHADGPRWDARKGCLHGPRLVYVIDANRKLYTFDPSQPTAASAFTLRATLSCPLPGGPHSMAVRMDGTAYVLYTTYSGSGYACAGLGRLELDTMLCTKAEAFSCATVGNKSFGMGYALSPSTGEETLYLGNDDAAFWALDPETGTLSSLGSLPDGGPELTGNSNGELWGFFPKVSPARVHQIDPLSGKAKKTLSLETFTVPWAGAFAFAAWGGLFYIFYGYQVGDSTDVYRLTPDGALAPLFLGTGLKIVGAGVSTCAPGT